MRIAIFAMLLCGETMALGQTGQPGTMPAQNADGWKVQPPQATQSGRVFLPPPEWRMKMDVPPMRQVFPGDLVWKDKLQVDPGMVVHPPQWSLGEQPKGTLMAQNLYPGLELLPITKPKGAGGPIPITWPQLKVEQIPTAWPMEKINPVLKGAAAK